MSEMPKNQFNPDWKCKPNCVAHDVMCEWIEHGVTKKDPDTITLTREELEGMKEPATAVRLGDYTKGYGDGHNAAIDAILEQLEPNS